MSCYIEVILNVPLFRSFLYKLPENINAQIGFRVEVPFGKRKMIGFITNVYKNEPENLDFDKNKIKEIYRIVDKEPIFNEDFIKLSKWISDFYICPQGEALSSMLPSGKREISGDFFSCKEDFSSTEVSLSDEQKNAIQNILSSDKTLHYLFGKTGTGKTEVFLQIAKEIIKKGGGVIYLVPEITLTHQVIESVTERFGNNIAVLHSGLTPSQKLFQWRRILNKEARIVIGARSAVFAPIPDLGLIIIDEEHDNSYKSGTTPRYHARQVAIKRCNDNKIPLIMGSATPSCEAYFLMQQGLIEKHTLTKRLAGGDTPEIRIVDLSKSKNDGCISNELAQEIQVAKNEGRQSILFLNRRGFTHFFRCNSCGFELKCKNCSISLTYHKSEKKLRCHYCGWSVSQPQFCPECGSLDIGYLGFGTEFIENEIKAKFPALKTIRIDTDALEKKGDLEEKLETFKNGNADILLGTQMIAKGLNFKGVKLVGIINADTGLHMPDFRAAERTFSLIVQVAGRAGRFFADGKVLVQSWSPERPAIKYACQNNFVDFYNQELEQREIISFPPFSRLIRLVFRSKDCAKAEKTAEDAYNALCTMDNSIEILGPAECPLAQVNNNYRFQILLKGKTLGPLQKLCTYFYKNFKFPQAVYIEIDVDPINLL